MNLKCYLLLLAPISLLISCQGIAEKEAKREIQKTISEQVDDAVKQLDQGIANFKKVVTLDHHKMAAEAGVYTPPSTAVIFSNSNVNSNLIASDQLIGLDLPFKILCYTEPDTLGVNIAYTSAQFIERRYALDENQLEEFNQDLEKAISVFPSKILSKTDLDSVTEGYGIIKIKSDFDFETTVQNLRNVVMSQNDTKWFADVDFQKEAAELQIMVRPTILLLFGGPAPGGKAMMTSPKIGLDAFCQKLLVFENESGDVWVAYNDIVAFAELYYQRSTKPQQVINQRLNTTFTSAITAQE